MSNHHTEYVLHGFTVKISQDDYMDSPDDWYDEDVFVGEVNTRHFRFGRKGWTKSSAEPHIPFGEGPWDIQNTDYYDLAHQTEDIDELRAHWEDEHDASRMVYPIRVHDHRSNGAAIVECDYDECDGYIFVRIPYSSDLERLTMLDFDPEAAKDGLLEVWNTYLSGDVHEVLVVDSDGEVIESIGGVYTHKAAEESAEELVKSLAGVTKAVPMVVAYGSLPLPFPNRLEAEVTQVSVPLNIGLQDAVRWAMEEGPFKDDSDVISVSLYQPRAAAEAAK